MSVHDDTLTWRQLGFDTDSDVLEIDNPANAVIGNVEYSGAKITRTYPNALHYEPGHTYMLTVDALGGEGSGYTPGDRLVIQLGAEPWTWLDAWAPCPQWAICAKPFTVSASQKTTDTFLRLATNDTHERTWKLRNLCLSDITSTVGGGEGK